MDETDATNATTRRRANQGVDLIDARHGRRGDHLLVETL